MPTSDLPDTWMQIKQKGRSYEFVDTSYVADASLTRLKEQFPGAGDISFSPMSLRELFVSAVNNAENQGR